MDLPEDVLRLISAPNTAHLATLLPDGAPHSVPVWVDVEGAHVAFLTSPNTRKARNIAGDPRVAISVTNRENAHDMACVRGRVVRIVAGDEGWAIIDRIAQKYLGAPYPVRTDRAAYLVAVEHAGAMSV